MRHLLQCLRHLVDIALVRHFVALCRVRLGDLKLAVLDHSCLGGECISGPRRGELCDRPDVAGVKLADLDGLAALQYVQFVNFLLNVLIFVVYRVIRLEYAGTHLDQRILSDKRIHDRLEDICGLCLCKIIVCLKHLVCLHVEAGDLLILRARHVFHNVVEQRVCTLAQQARTHADRNDGAVDHVCPQRCADLIFRKGLPAEVAIHKLLAGLGYRLHQRVPVQIQIVHAVIRDLARLHVLALPAVSRLAHDIDIAHKLLILPDRKMERCDLLAVHLREFLHNVLERRVVCIHTCHIYHPRQLVLLTQLPRLLCPCLDAGLARHHDDRCICRTDSLLNLTYEVKIPGGIKDVDLHTLPLDRHDGCAYGNLSLLLFLAKIADGIAVFHFSHA